ncbi:MAG: ABC transporter permease [Candidatus Promineifilaceae bacterium]|nr:ABC transporter permease [Candidatus Promineifilaceae bacterium]
MRKITAIAWKDILIQFSSRSALLFFIILPVVFTFIVGSSFGGAGAQSGVPLLVVNQDTSALANDLISALRETGTVEVRLLAADPAADAFANEEAPALLTIPADFGTSLQRGQPVTLALRKAPDNINAEAADQAVIAAVGAISRPLMVAQSVTTTAAELLPFASPADEQAYFAESLVLARATLGQGPARIERTRAPDAAETIAFDINAQASIGQLITWVFIPLLGTSGLLVLERTQGTLRRLVVSPTRPGTFLLGTIGGQMLTAAVQMTLLILFGVYVMNVDWGQSVPGLALMLGSFALAAVALGIMMGTFTRTTSQASNASIATGMAMALLGGAWMPLEFFPHSAQTVAQILPTTWAMQGLTELVMRGGGVVDVLPFAGGLVGFAVLFFAIGVWRFRYE